MPFSLANCNSHHTISGRVASRFSPGEPPVLLASWTSVTPRPQSLCIPAAGIEPSVSRRKNPHWKSMGKSVGKSSEEWQPWTIWGSKLFRENLGDLIYLMGSNENTNGMYKWDLRIENWAFRNQTWGIHKSTESLIQPMVFCYPSSNPDQLFLWRGVAMPMF